MTLLKDMKLNAGIYFVSTFSKLVHIYIEIGNVHSTLLKVVNSYVDVHNVVSMLI